jgi:hypothetical protein
MTESGKHVAVDHPLDEYVVASLTEAALLTGVSHVFCWGDAMHPRLIAIQRMAQRMGLACHGYSHPPA